MIVSISHYTFDAVSKSSDPNANPLCRHKIRAVREGKSVDLMVVDRCTHSSFIYYCGSSQLREFCRLERKANKD